MRPKIKVVGIGGSGGNTVWRMKKNQIKGVEFLAINTDVQDLKKIKADIKLRIGKRITQGLGAGMNPEIGKMAAEEQREEIKTSLKETDLVFITYGTGGGTGTGAGPVVAEIAKELGSLTVAVVTFPFSFEGQTRQKIAQEGIEKLTEKVDSLIIIKNDKMLAVLDEKTTIVKAFLFCDDILRQAIQGVSDLVYSTGMINVDFADLKTILQNSGTAIFGIGKARGPDRVEKAIKQVLSFPLLDISPKGAKGILFNLKGGKDLSINEVEEIARKITQEINPQAKIIFGANQDTKMIDEIELFFVATGF